VWKKDPGWGRINPDEKGPRKKRRVGFQCSLKKHQFNKIVKRGGRIASEGGEKEETANPLKKEI